MRGSMRVPNFLRRSSWGILNAGVALAMTACGGGGGGGSDPPAQPANPPVNAAPTNVQAGADQTITLPATSATLTGSATDDGLPAPATLTYAWTASPAGVTFSSTSTAATTATFAGAGTYTLTLTVSDGALSSTDTVQVVVNAAAGSAPVVQAGADQTIELPLKASLQGSATDDGTPAPPSLTYAWTGPTGVTFDNAAAASTQASFSTAGSYELTLTASDGAAAGTDTVTVTVGPAMYPAADNDSDAVNHGWTRVAAAADVGMNQALLDTATTYAQSADAPAPAIPSSGVIVRRGRIVHSWGDIDRRFDLKSTTKSIGGIALGLALDEAKFLLTDTAVTYLPSIGNPPVENVATGWLPQITIQQLATHTAGFRKPGGYIPLDFQPGTTWSYSDGGLNWLADLLTTVYARDLRDVLTERVWNVVGVSNTDDVVWRNQIDGLRPDPRPAPAPQVEYRELASGIIANANAMARVGLLFLRRGAWADQRIVSESFVDTVRTPVAANAGLALPDAANFPNATVNYGVLWWTNANGQLPNVPRDAYWGWGLGDSLIIVIPSLDLVIARAGPQVTTPTTGRTWNDSDWNGDYTVLAPFLEPIVQSVAP